MVGLEVGRTDRIKAMAYQPNDDPLDDEREQRVSRRVRRTGPRPLRAARMTISVLPTLMTLGNVLSGFAAIFFASRRRPTRSCPWGGRRWRSRRR